MEIPIAVEEKAAAQKEEAQQTDAIAAEASNVVEAKKVIVTRR